MIISQILFTCFVLASATGVVVAVARYAGARLARSLSICLIVWFIYVALLWRLGILAKANALPPGMIFILIPVVVYLVVILLLQLFGRMQWSLQIPIWLPIGAQGFRVIVELFIHQLWHDGVVPRMLTFSGANVDIYIGASALLIAPLASRGAGGTRVAMAWNILGLLALANVVVRAILTAPGPINFFHTDPPNAMFITFPFMFIPAFFVPLAVTLHLFSFRTLVDRNRRS